MSGRQKEGDPEDYVEFEPDIHNQHFWDEWFVLTEDERKHYLNTPSDTFWKNHAESSDATQIRNNHDDNKAIYDYLTHQNDDDNETDCVSNTDGNKTTKEANDNSTRHMLTFESY